jgi:hypothetical protein
MLARPPHQSAAARDDASVTIRCSTDIWNISELQAQLGIVSADLPQRFVTGKQ